jgi:hypothetical protein
MYLWGKVRQAIAASVKFITNPVAKTILPSPRLRHPSPTGEGTGVRAELGGMRIGFRIKYLRKP